MKIDIVYTWVNGTDPIWHKKMLNYANQSENILPLALNESRFMDNDELKYSLRSVNLFAPWVNNIFIVTDNQVPNWLDLTHPKIKIIDHSEIFSTHDPLPSFSARGIETQLHHIKGLSEHFIYFNDDMFLGNKSEPTHFFTKKGVPHIFVSEILQLPKKKYFDHNKQKDVNRNDHQQAIYNTRKLLKDKLGKSIYYNIRHVAKPLRKSILNEIENNFQKELDYTSRNRFRTNDDILIIVLFCYYSIMKNIAKPKYLRRIKSDKKENFVRRSINNFTFSYINLHEENIEKKFQSIMEKKPLLICLNQTPTTPQNSLGLYRNFLQELFPIKSPFEKDS